MGEGSVWEIKLLRYVCIGLFIILLIANVDHLINLSGSPTAIIIRLSGLTFLPILCISIAIKASQKKLSATAISFHSRLSRSSERYFVWWRL